VVLGGGGGELENNENPRKNFMGGHSFKT